MSRLFSFAPPACVSCNGDAIHRIKAINAHAQSKTGAKAMTDAKWIEDVLHFWFRELEPSQWFVRDERVDAMIGERFATLHERVAAMGADEHASPQAALAAVIVLDQFPRNMYRATPRAFASDALALKISAAAIQHGFDRALAREERVFLYMPWQHSENRADQARSVELFQQLDDANALDYARQHHEIIDRFGRFPHRNRVLQRTSTPDEIEFMKTHAGF